MNELLSLCGGTPLSFLSGAISAVVVLLIVSGANLRKIEREHEARMLDVMKKLHPELD